MTELASSYQPENLENKWYAWWLEKELFTGDVDAGGEPFSIVIPPPNVTGSLHMGHALNNTLQDVICRWKRMQGYNVLWVPGTDHAGIATQNVVERNLAGEGIDIHELGREEFVNQVWEWKETYGNKIINQLKKLGASCDWSRERFTMDEGLSRAVREVFVQLYKKGLIYKGEYIINWCPRCHTALSDLEVEHTEVEGKLYWVRYPFVDGEGSIEIATTRPETILGDVAIAVHPRDERNRHHIGKSVRVPMNGREIPIIEDDMVDPEFGTGFVKITPAHDPNDFLVGQRHGLLSVQVIDEAGIMNEQAGTLQGLDRFAAREQMVQHLGQTGRLVKQEPHHHAVGHCYRCNTVVEPYLSEQWFVQAKPLAERGVQAVREGQIQWIPEQWVRTYYQWMENIRDWCISRQLWWGHRIPAWTCADCGHVTVAETDPDVCEACGSVHIEQESDVLDTWFSSALWPFSTLGWPENTRDLETFYPTGLLVTGFDIIFFWVSRMIMMGLECMDEIPFRDVYIHALVRDAQGQKMSKSKGNVIDPLEIINIHGADALRFTLCALTVQGRDIILSEEKITTYRHYLNKLWNAGRFALMHGGETTAVADIAAHHKEEMRLCDYWILSRLDNTVTEVTEALEGYYFGEAARKLYDFVWAELCDWYLELIKPTLRGHEGNERKLVAQGILSHVMRTILLLQHPFIPFVTEELWHAFRFGDNSIEQEPWPSSSGYRDETAEEAFHFFMQVVRTIRNLRAIANLSPKQKVGTVHLTAMDDSRQRLVEEVEDQLSLLSGVEKVLCSHTTERPAGSLAEILPDATIYLPVGDLIDIAKEIERLEEELGKAAANITRCDTKLANQQFLDNAPAEIVEKERARREDYAKRRAQLEATLETLRSV
ncbi:MAG: valine--tRNA ligase [Synergistales bacterium]|nr:valine--tRNA ligase [Synergistales bacterium]